MARVRSSRRPRPARVGAIGAGVGAAPGAAAAAASLHAGATRQAAIIRSTVAAFEGIWKLAAARRDDLLVDWLVGRAVPADDIAAALAEEAEREGLFQRKARKRVEAAMRLALRASDPSARAAAVQAVLERERRFEAQRANSSAERVLAAAERSEVRRLSPQGALWQLGPRENHCPLCLVLAGKFLPWSALRIVKPPLHPLCGCRLRFWGDAIAEGLLRPGQELSEAAARALVAPIEAQLGRDREAALAESAEAELTARLVLLERGSDADVLAAVPLAADGELAEQAEPWRFQNRDWRGRWVRMFSGPAAAVGWMREHWGGWEDRLVSEDRDLATYYQRHREGAGNLNAALRSGSALMDHERELRDALDRVVAETPSLTEHVVSWRSIPTPPVNWQDPQPGDVVEDDGFWSVSLSHDVAALDYGGGGPGAYLLRIILPKGTRAAPVELLADDQEEGELLLARGSRFRVGRVDVMPGGAKLIELELLR